MKHVINLIAILLISMSMMGCGTVAVSLPPKWTNVSYEVESPAQKQIC